MSRRPERAGRYWVGFWLALFLIVAMAIVARQQSGLGIAGRLAKQRQRRGELEARRAELQAKIEEASSQPVLGAKVARMGLAVAPDSANTILYLGDSTRGRR
ncbi:MAG: hypothetical protein AB7L66_22060 [Gemmatimonadales bacterium]